MCTVYDNLYNIVYYTNVEVYFQSIPLLNWRNGTP